MTTISAKTILRSRNTSNRDKVLTTLLLRYPRFIHAELMTHRVFSRNSASSRAIPIKKMIEDILADTAMPIHWGKHQSGMQAFEECDNLLDVANYEHYDSYMTNKEAWLEARDVAINFAKAYDKAGYHKQIANRLLEPFLHITVLVSSTEWENFLTLRDHPDAEPHIQMLAKEIRKCLGDESNIQDLNPGEWHLPFITEEEKVIYNLVQLQKLSMARCASTSYKTTDGFDMTMERAEKIFDKLVSSDVIHASPTEHVAQADSYSKFIHWLRSNKWLGWLIPKAITGWSNSKAHRNFVGFNQYRALLEFNL